MDRMVPEPVLYNSVLFFFQDHLASSGYNFGGVLKNHILTLRIQYKF